MEWEVPEDRVQADVQAEARRPAARLRGCGAPPMSHRLVTAQTLLDTTEPVADLPVVVIGAGVSGLAAATFLQGSAPLLVLEAGARPGGNVQSDVVEGRVLDRAANGWLDNEPAMGRLLERVGLAEQVVPAGPKAKVRWIYADGALHPAPLSPPALLRSRLLGWGAKLRLLLEPLIGRGPRDGDETVGAFVRRRLGGAIVDRLVGPMVAGIYAADPDRLSLRAAFERLHQLERTHRSLLLGALKLRGSAGPRGHLETLPGGAAPSPSTSPTAWARPPPRDPGDEPERRQGRWRSHAARGRRCQRGGPGLPRARAGPAGRGFDADAANALADIPYAPVAVVASR